jgi:hypothetical protein
MVHGTWYMAHGTWYMATLNMCGQQTCDIGQRQEMTLVSQCTRRFHVN